MRKLRIVFLLIVSAISLTFIIVTATPLDDLKYDMTMEVVGTDVKAAQILNTRTFFGNKNWLELTNEGMDMVDLFCFYSVNNVIVEHEKDYRYHFDVREAYEFKAYFKDPDTHFVVFLDSHNEIISFQTVVDGEDAIAPQAPIRDLGYTFSRWNQSFENVTKDLIITAIFDKPTDKYTVTLKENIDSQVTTVKSFTKSFGNIALFEAELNKEDATFSHWLVDGKVRSFNSRLGISVYEDVVVEAVYSYAPYAEQYIVYLNDIILETDERYYLRGAYEYNSKNINIVDFGIIYMPYSGNAELIIGNKNVSEIKPLKERVNSFNEFAVSIKKDKIGADSHYIARAFIVQRFINANGDNEHRVFYTDIIHINKPS